MSVNKSKTGSSGKNGSEAQEPAWRKNLFSTILANTDDGVSVQDRNMRVIYANAAHKRMLGDDLEGRYCYQVYERRPELCPDCPVEMAFNSGKPFRTTHFGNDKEGNPLAAEIIATPIFDDQGEIVAGLEVVRFVTEQVKAQQQIVEKNHRLEKLAHIAREISSGLDPDKALSRVVKNAVEMSGADWGVVGVINELRQVIEPRYHYNMPPDLELPELPLHKGVTSRILEAGKPIVVNDYVRDPDHLTVIDEVFEKYGVNSMLLAPVMVGDKPLGTLGLFILDQKRVFSQDDVENSMIIADQAAVALENARLFKETSERLHIQRELNKVAISITSGLDLDKILDQVVIQAAGIVKADSAAIALLDEERDLITFPYTHNLPTGISQLTLPYGNGVASEVIRKMAPLIVDDYAGTGRGVKEFIDAGIKALAGVPLMIGDHCMGIIGVMTLGGSRKFTDEDIEILSLVSRQAAVAVENARLYSKLSRSAQKLENRVKERTEALSRMYQESERKSRDLEEANLKLRELDRMKSEFLANMSHELRTPLNSIIGFSKLILDGLDGEVNEEQTKDLDIVHANGLELLRLIDDLLNLAKIEAGRVALFLEEVAPGDLAEQAVASQTSIAREKGLTLETAIPAGLKPVVLDPGKVRQILLNLIGNAIKFTKEGSIEVTVEQAPDETVFSVRDTGIGILPERTEAIFDRFHQESPGLATSAGVGLGLTISKRFAEMHQGRIWVDSRPGEGSTFHVSIPHDLSVST